jgi:hypothetical protein
MEVQFRDFLRTKRTDERESLGNEIIAKENPSFEETDGNSHEPNPSFSGSHEALGRKRFIPTHIGNFAHFLKYLRLRFFKQYIYD